MGTNYYYDLYKGSVELEEELHIGKSSVGWVFSMHVIPEKNLNSLHEWVAFILSAHGNIRNEYGKNIYLGELLRTITERKFDKPLKEVFEPDGFYCSIRDFYKKNEAEPGPRNLIRYKIDGTFCVGHGEGTWDYIIGEFS